ncbi:MAG: FAD-dependent oxidoreductase [Pseudomonadales bacterium]|nr:FAD-dependent oxidoreductase [Pseudomonadales bacterium]MCP5184599.1 FAD-dependent oxidoreductase [Pseudomonadales bacterium]
MSTVVIIGAGHAAGQAAASLRQDGHDGPIVILGDEPYIPYQRPPLSKQYLSGEQGLDRVYLRPQKFYDDKHIDLRTGVTVDAIDRNARTVHTTAGDTIAWDKLIIATGSRVRRLTAPGSDLAGIHYLRTVTDVDGLRGDIVAGKKLVIVGGGYIGLEVASVAVTAGMEVHVIEMEARILQRVTTPEMSAYYHQLHTSRGVHIHTGMGVLGFTGEKGRVTAVNVPDGSFAADAVLVGIGIIPNVELARDAGLECDNGIVVDDHCRTSDPDIYAIGDCTNHPNPLLGRRLRLESVPNAMEQARVTSGNIMGGDKVYAAIPWFWSDQYELKLQMVGFSADGNQQVLRGDMAANQFAMFYLKDGVVVAADAVNSPKEFMLCKQMIGKAVDATRLGDPTADLKALISA